MRKLSTIDESFWGDVHKRSIGDDVRKEDDINVLDFDAFYQYLRDRYKNEGDENEGIFKKFDTDCIHLVIPIEMFGVKMPKRPSYSPCRFLNFTYSTQNEEFSDIIISRGLITIYPDLVSELEKNFELKDTPDSQHLKPKADKITNQMIIDLIDTCLAKVDNPILIKESFWGDVHKRSIGDNIRKEDDINLLDKDGLYEYLISHYKSISGRDIKNYISCGKHYIHLCIFIYRDVKYSILLDILNCRVKVRTPYIKRWPANLLDIIDKKYNREDTIDHNKDRMTFITPKEGNGNNQFYIDFLDMMLNNADKPLLEKVINESFWGDVHRRSRGDEVRKENDPYGFVKIFNDIKKIPDSELFLGGGNSETLWMPYNFGSTSPDQPGLFLDGEKTIALAELLEGTEYHIAWQSDWQALQAAGMEYRKINGYWTFIFKNIEGAELYVPYFGYISAYYAEHPEEKPKITKPVKGDLISYGAIFSNPPKPGWVDLELYKGYYNAKQWHISPTVYTDSFQVRLVKTPGLKS